MPGAPAPHPEAVCGAAMVDLRQALISVRSMNSHDVVVHRCPIKPDAIAIGAHPIDVTRNFHFEGKKILKIPKHIILL